MQTRGLLALLLLGVACARTWAAPSPQLPSDLNAWNLVPGFLNRTRLWDAALLGTAIVNRGHPSHIRTLLDKLNAGKPIVAVALGSSLVHDYAGCWQPSLQSLWDLGIIPNPSLYPQASAAQTLRDWEHIWDKCSSGGYMEGFMATLNRTWPHSKHVFVNNGKGGTCLQHISESACLSAYMPKAIDLVLLDTVTNLCEPGGGEKVLRQLLKLTSRPLVVLLSNSRNCRQNQTLALHRRCQLCMANAHGRPDAPDCQGLTPLYTREDYLTWDKSVAPYQRIARHYRVPHISLIEVMQRLMDGGLAQQLGKTPLEVQSMFYHDAVHLRKEELGTLLVADLLVNLLHTSIAQLESLPEQHRATLSYRLPHSTVFESAGHSYRTRCYGPTVKQAIERLQSVDDRDARTAAATLQATSPGDFFAWGNVERQEYASFNSLPELKVVRSTGWALQVEYTDVHLAVKLKPGFVTNTSGSVLEVEVDSAFPQLEHVPAQLLVTFLTSYDGWGMVEVSCPYPACSCESATLDAATEVRHSLSRMHPVERVTQHAACVVRFEVLPTTASGGHKFKVSSVSVRVEDTQ